MKAGEHDEEYLSLSSLGQQARIHLWLGEISPAAHLYAQQVAQGDHNGSLSLQYLSSYLVNPQNFEALKLAIDDPLIQQLVTVELFTRSGNLRNIDSGDDRSKKIIVQILALLNEKVSVGFSGSDRLAALAYRSGQYPMAGVLLKNAGDNGLAWWLRAKMALRTGDIKAATAAYAKASAAFPSNESWGEQRNEDFVAETIVPVCRVSGEQAILALARGDYLQAIEWLYKGKEMYWADVADVAERVLTINELQAFVDKNAPLLAPDQPVAEVSRLRELLARRLMRSGRYQDAQPYFEHAAYRQWAQQYTDQLKIAENNTADSMTRAAAYYQAATLLHEHGMEFTGYEMTPDYNIYDGNYSYLVDAFDTRNLLHKSWITAAEAVRNKAALPARDKHFLHYRWQASDLATKGADLLNPKSKTYAAVLCNAASWVIKSDAKKGHQLYQRYLSNGTRYDWTPKFGYQCPIPDFGKKR